jgi:nitrate/TMAO reductase-like tetraheme cytochrome c subunit
MWSRVGRLAAGALVAVFALAAGPGVAAAGDEEGCLGCHGLEGFAVRAGGAVRALTIAPEPLAASAHGQVSCRDCHAEIAAIPHEEPRPVGCGQACHSGSKAGKDYSHEALYWEYAASVHGVKKIPCLRCHPAPALTGDAGRDKRAEARQCAACHRAHPVVQGWFGDVHFAALARGDARAPSCPDCHTAHRVWPKSAPQSSVSPRRLAETCGRGALATGQEWPCHGQLGESAVAGAAMNPLPPGGRRRGAGLPLATALFGALLAGLVCRAGIGWLTRR